MSTTLIQLPPRDLVLALHCGAHAQETFFRTRLLADCIHLQGRRRTLRVRVRRLRTERLTGADTARLALVGGELLALHCDLRCLLRGGRVVAAVRRGVLAFRVRAGLRTRGVKG